MSQITDVPAAVDAVDLQLGELKGGIKGLGTDPDDNWVDGQEHALYHFLCKAIFTGDTQKKRDSEAHKISSAYQQ